MSEARVGATGDLPAHFALDSNGCGKWMQSSALFCGPGSMVRDRQGILSCRERVLWTISGVFKRLRVTSQGQNHYSNLVSV